MRRNPAGDVRIWSGLLALAHRVVVLAVPPSGVLTLTPPTRTRVSIRHPRPLGRLRRAAEGPRKADLAHPTFLRRHYRSSVSVGSTRNWSPTMAQRKATAQRGGDIGHGSVAWTIAVDPHPRCSACRTGCRRARAPRELLSGGCRKDAADAALTTVEPVVSPGGRGNHSVGVRVRLGVGVDSRIP